MSRFSFPETLFEHETNEAQAFSSQRVWLCSGDSLICSDYYCNYFKITEEVPELILFINLFSLAFQSSLPDALKPKPEKGAVNEWFLNIQATWTRELIQNGFIISHSKRKPPLLPQQTKDLNHGKVG